MRHRLGRWLCLLAVLVALTSCSALKLSYEKADWLLAHWAQRYVDLTAEQTRALRSELAKLQRWHRAHELPEYARAFDRAAVQLEAGMTRAQIQVLVDMVRARAGTLGVRAGQSFAPLVTSLSEAQLRDLQRRFAADNRRFERRHLSGSPAELAERRNDWMESRLEDWFGSLDRTQRARVQRLVAAFPDMPALRLAERRRRQAALLEVAREGGAGGAAGVRLGALLANLERGGPAPVHAAMVRWEHAFIDMLSELEDSLSSAQRAHAAARLRQYADDFRELARRQATAVL